MVPEPPRYTERGADQVAVNPVRSYLSRLIHACAPLMDGLGHATWSGTVPVSRARTLSFQKNRHFIFHVLVYSTEVFGIDIALRPPRSL